MLVAGLAPVMRSPAHNAPDNELDDDCSIDEVERLDYADQEPEPLPFPTPTGVLGPMAQFLWDMSDFMALKKFCIGPFMHF